MKFSLLFSLLFLVTFNVNCQTTDNKDSLSFEELYEKASEDYENEVINSPYYDKALNNCPDIKKYPRLLMYKGLDLYFSNQKILAVKYLELAKLNTTDEEDILSTTYNLSLIYADLGQHEKSTLYLKENLKKATEIGNEFYKTESTFNLLIEEYINSKKKPPLSSFWIFYNSLKDKSNDDKVLYLNSFFECLNDLELYDEASIVKNYISKNFTLDSLSISSVYFFNINNTLLSLGLKDFPAALKYNNASYNISKKHLGLNDVLGDLINYKEIYEQDNKFDIALKYVDSIKKIEEKLNKTNIKTSLEIVDENIIFNKTKIKAETKIKDYKTTIIIICLIAIVFLILFILRNKKQKSKLKNLNSELKVNKGKYNKSLKENIAFKNDLKELLKSKKFDEISKLHKAHEINDINNETYIVYLASDIEKTFLSRLEKQTFTFSDIEKVVLFYRKNNHTYKEIALITGRSLRSIQSLAYRLNKKIQTKTGLELANFLEKI